MTDIVKCPVCNSTQHVEVLRTDFNNDVYHALVKCGTCYAIWHQALNPESS